MNYGEERLHVRMLGSADKKKIGDFLERTPTYSTLMMQGPYQNFESFGGWWYGVIVIDSQEVRALACVENHAANMYAESDQAAEEMGSKMLKAQKNLSRKAGVRHQVFGERRTVEKFWHRFQHINRTVDVDKVRLLVGATTPGERLRDTVTVSRATAKDLKVVFEFGAGYTIEQWGVDPRKTSKDSHRAYCESVIEEGRQVVAYKGAKPIFIAEIVDQGEGTAMLNRIFVPRPFRTFKKMASTALVGATELALENAKELLLFADESDDFMTKVVEMAGFEERGSYRSISMRG